MNARTGSSAERMVRANGIELCVQSFGDPGDPAVLLIGGAESSMDWWDEALCARLAGAGRYVIRYDTRDTGRSTTFPVGAPGYAGDELITDAIGVLDAFGLPSAHIVGLSAGGALAQHLGVRHRDRVASLTLVSTSPDGPGAPDAPELPPMSPALAKTFQEPSPGPDWTDRESVIAYFLDAEATFGGAIPVDEQRVRGIAGRVFDRSPAIAAATNHWLLEGGESVRHRFGEITAPTLVLHGTDDPLFPYGHGEALAREIPGAELVPLPGMGHQFPPPEVWDVFVPAVVRHTGRP